MSISVPTRIIGRTPGRALYIASSGRCYISRGYEILYSDDWGASWQLDCTLPRLGIKPVLARFSLAERLMRYNVAALQVMDDGTRIASAREGIYRAGPSEANMNLVFRTKRGSRPWHFCVDGQRVLFGEYGDSFKELEVFIYVSEDGGRTFEVGYKFPRGSIRHVHNVIFDPHLNHYWVLVGDFDTQPGIGALSKDLKTIEWLRRGDQKSRVMSAIVLPDELIYSTDSEIDRNYIIRMEKCSGRIREIQEVEGSSLYAAAFGPILAISTCVEPSLYRITKECALYLSRDGDSWQRVLTHQKDWYPSYLFQFGTLALPYCCHPQPFGMFSGQAVVGAHDRVTLLDFHDHEVF